MLSPDDQARITAAVTAAEDGTSGDIFCVLAGEVSSYREVPIAWGAIAALLVPPAVLAFSLRPLLEAATGGWVVTDARALPHALGIAMNVYVVAQVALFGLVATLLNALPPVRRLVTPRFLKRHRVRKAAFHHFAAAHSHVRDSDTGVLIFVALVERQVEVLADAAIHAKVGDAVWKEAAAAVQAGMKTPDPTDGIVQAIALCGAALKAHFPIDGARSDAHRAIED
jgi:putative membrane protein